MLRSVLHFDEFGGTPDGEDVDFPDLNAADLQAPGVARLMLDSCEEDVVR